ncbi:hypothetical protein B0O80DRAFT_503640 [Mortierella sp. GBAus27b]|nr:hypothetical protein B0O80DRAFT_503640 [Mortierella sp. GBAus27b]
MSTESQMTQESEGADVESVGGPHRLSSVHSPTTPLPSSPVVNGLKDLHDLDPDSSEWEEVYAWRRVWNAERSTAIGVDVTRSGTDAQEESSPEKQAKDEETRLAKLQAQASRRCRIVDEIVATERTYVEGLKGLVEIYLTPALQVMPLSDHKAVFSNAQAIYTFHANHFLPELEKAHRIASTPTQQPSASAGQGARSPTSPLPTSSSFTSDPSAPSSARSSAVPSDAQNDARLSQASTTSATDNAAESATDAAGETIEIKDAPPSAQTIEAEASDPIICHQVIDGDILDPVSSIPVVDPVSPIPVVDAGSSLLVNDIADSTQDSTPTSEMCAIIKL